MKKRILAGILTLTLVLTLCLSLTSCGGGGGSDAESKGEVHVYCFGDYIDDTIIGEFESQTGISVVLDTFDTNEEMYPVIKNNSVNYDVVCTSDYMIEKLMSESLLQELNYDNIPNAANVEESYLKIADKFDPGNVYSLPHTWGTLGIIYNPEFVKEGEITSWNDLWKDKYEQQIVMPDSLRDNFAIALKAKGYSINSTDENEVNEASQYMAAQKPLVYKYANDSARDLILGGSANIAVIWSGEVLYCQETNPDLKYVIPSEGTEEFMDSWCIPATAENKENAEAWINFLLDKQTAVTNYEYLTYTIPNKAVSEYIADDEAAKAVIFPDESQLENCETLKSFDPEVDDMYSEYWKKFKAL